MVPRIALVTGASRGIGKAIAHRLGREGYDVALNDLPSQATALESLRQDLLARGRRSSIHIADVSKESQVAEMVSDTVKSLGGLDVMVANAGIARITPTETLGTIDIWDHVMSVNARGAYLCYKYAAEVMIAQGRGGRIIGASSIVGKQGYCFATAYSASKFAIRGLTQSAAHELGKYGITVNAYAPGPIDTPILATVGLDPNTLKEVMKQEAEKTVLGRVGTPEEIAHLVSYLASEESAFTTGQTISVNGGQFFD